MTSEKNGLHISQARELKAKAIHSLGALAGIVAIAVGSHSIGAGSTQIGFAALTVGVAGVLINGFNLLTEVGMSD